MRLTPRGGRDRIDGITSLADGRVALKARVSVPPEDGRANTALLRLMATAAGVPGSQARLVSGATSRLKTLHLGGDPELIIQRLEALAAARAG